MNQNTTDNKINSLLARLTNIAIIVGVATFIAGERQRHNLKVYQAWQTINTAHGQSGDGGRRKAIEFLNSSNGRKFPWFWKARQKYNLTDLDVSKASLYSIDLSNAELVSANFQQARLGNANFQNADLFGVNFQDTFANQANFQNANLNVADFKDAYLDEVNFQNAYLKGADFEEAHSARSNFQNANLEWTIFRDAYLGEAKLRDANLEQAELQNAVLKRADFKNANLKQANLHNANLDRAKNLTARQIKSACFWEQAIYYETREGLEYVPKEPENKQFIDKLKADSTTDPPEEYSCR